MFGPNALESLSASDSADLFVPIQTAVELHLPCFVTTPHQENPEFVGREDVLKIIHEALAPVDHDQTSQRTFALCGLGGMGKTQIAVKYVFSHRDDFRVVLWAHADNRTKLSESYSRFTVELGLQASIGSDQNTAKEKLKEWLEKTGW
jgi:hypothetical protein